MKTILAKYSNCINIVYADNIPYKNLSRLIKLPTRCIIKWKPEEFLDRNEEENILYVIYIENPDGSFGLGWISPVDEVTFLKTEYEGVKRFYRDNPNKVFKT